LIAVGSNLPTAVNFNVGLRRNILDGFVCRCGTIREPVNIFNGQEALATLRAGTKNPPHQQVNNAAGIVSDLSE